MYLYNGVKRTEINQRKPLIIVSQEPIVEGICTLQNLGTSHPLALMMASAEKGFGLQYSDLRCDSSI